MKRIIFKKEELSQLPIPESGFVTIGVSTDGMLKTISNDGVITSIGNEQLAIDANSEALAAHIASQIVKDDEQDTTISNLVSDVSSIIDVKDLSELNAEALASHISSQIVKDDEQDTTISSLVSDVSSVINAKELSDSNAEALASHITNQLVKDEAIINEVNTVTSTNFDNIYSKKVGVTFDSMTGVATFATPVKPLSVMFFIDGLIIEEGTDYSEVVDGSGLVTGISFVDPAIATGGVTLVAYGVYGDFTNISSENI